ncbi:MAG: hypothetical protein DYG88_05990 [Chloroflexi bacterium CFX4]|nr:hypothetical protein [Chloroflexi bacterium CFX4]MDL1922837.1 hypothetical protein [Chloroflexi bacterium CFX3]
MSDPYGEIHLAIATYDHERARDLLRKAIRENPTAEVYYLASQVALNNTQKKDFLKKAVALDPFHKEATYLLSRLESGAPIWSSSPEAYTAKSVQSGSQSYALAGVGARLAAYLLDGIVLIPIRFAT